MKIDIGAPRTDSEALNALMMRRRDGDAFILAGPGDPVQRMLTGLLAEHGLDLTGLRPRSLRLPDPVTAALIVIAGGEPHAIARNQEERDRELAWIRAADAAGTPVLGIGHGARALADAFGGRIEPAAVSYHGWAFVETTAPHQIAGGPWPIWQHDVITLPPRATVIAHNRFGPQAFRIGRHLGVQFHPEATAATVARWALTDPAITTRTMRRDPAAAATCAQQLFRSFLSAL